MRLHWLTLACALAIALGAAACSDDDCDCPDDEGDSDDDDDDAGDPQVEITEPTPLLNPDGSLAAVGWARRPLVQYNPEYVPADDRGRLKEWDAYLMIAPDFMFGITVSDIKLATFISFEMIDFHTTEITTGLELRVGSLGFMPTDMYGTIDYDFGGNRFTLTYDRGVRTIVADFAKSAMSPAWNCALTLTQNPEEEDLAAVSPYREEGTYFYENKIVGMVVSGDVTVDGRSYQYDPSTAFATLDWGRGVIPHVNEWHWGVAAARVDGRIVGFNIGDGWNDDSLGTANAQKIGGRLHKLYRVSFDYDPNDMLEPWRIESDDGRMQMDLEPFFYQNVGMMILDIGMVVDKVYGRFSGTMTTDDGEPIAFDDMIGFVEWSAQRW